MRVRMTCDNEVKEKTVDSLRRAGRACAGIGAALCLMGVLLLSGCHNFFVCEGKASCPSGGGGGSTTSDYVYVSNATAGATYISAYNIGNGSLAAISGSPYNLNYTPVAMT